MTDEDHELIHVELENFHGKDRHLICRFVAGKLALLWKDLGDVNFAEDGSWRIEHQSCQIEFGVATT